MGEYFTLHQTDESHAWFSSSEDPTELHKIGLINLQRINALREKFESECQDIMRKAYHG